MAERNIQKLALSRKAYIKKYTKHYKTVYSAFNRAVASGKQSAIQGERGQGMIGIVKDQRKRFDGQGTR